MASVKIDLITIGIASLEESGGQTMMPVAKRSKKDKMTHTKSTLGLKL